MTFTRCALGILTCGAIHLALPLGCVDTSPLVYMASDASPMSSGTDCLVCLRRPDTPGPGCGDEFAACNAGASCKETLACAVAIGCIDRPPAESVTCGLTCTKEAGLLAQNDPNFQLLAALYKCLSTPVSGCGGVCFAAGRPDASE